MPKENPSKGFSLDSFGNKRAAALLRSRESQIYSAHPVERLLRILEALSFWHASTYWHVKSLTIFLPSSKFERLVRRKAFLPCKNPCVAGCNGGRGTSSQRTQSPRKEISRGNLLCAESGLTNLSYPRLQSVQKYVGTPNRYNRPYRAARGARGAAPLCLGRSPEETLSRVSFGQLLLDGRRRSSLRS